MDCTRIKHESFSLLIFYDFNPECSILLPDFGDVDNSPPLGETIMKISYNNIICANVHVLLSRFPQNIQNVYSSYTVSFVNLSRKIKFVILRHEKYLHLRIVL